MPPRTTTKNWGIGGDSLVATIDFVTKSPLSAATNIKSLPYLIYGGDYKIFATNNPIVATQTLLPKTNR